MPVWVPDTPLLVQLPANAAGKAVEYGPLPYAPTVTEKTHQKLLAPGHDSAIVAIWEVN